MGLKVTDKFNGEVVVKISRSIIASFVLAGSAGLAAEAGISYTYSGPGGDIADAPSNTVPAFSIYSMEVTDTFIVDQLSSVTVQGLSHAWCGDVSITLSHGGVEVTLVHRVGWTGGSFFGDSSNFAGDYAFSDGATGDLWGAANGGSSNYAVPGGDYFATGLDGVPVSIGEAFRGHSAAGTWALTIGDWGPTETGSLDGFSFSVTAVPAPGCVALLALAMGRGRSRRRH